MPASRITSIYLGYIPMFKDKSISIINMKKIFLKISAAVIAAVFLFFSLSACDDGNGGSGNPDGNNPGAPSDEGFNPYPYEDLSVFMDVPDYKNITVERKLLDKFVMNELSVFFVNNGLYRQVSGRAVKEGDYVNISYVGFIDGNTFDGGTAMGYDLLIGGGAFIEGFEDGVIGMTENESRNLTLRFPDDYGHQDYAGKDVTFTVTVNKIQEPPELTDSLCAQYTPFDTREEFLYQIEENCKFSYAWDLLMSQCTIKSYPQEYTEYYQYFTGYFTSLAKEANCTLAEFVALYGDSYSGYGLYNGMSIYEFEALATNYARSNLVNDLLTYSILRLENVKTEGEEFDAAVKKLERESGMSYEEMVAQNGENAVIISVLNIRLGEIINSYVRTV